ncbi:MAG: polysaccharide deacetylase family protein [Pseudomonas sp.]
MLGRFCCSLFLLSCALYATFVQSAGPVAFATIDRSGWPLPMNSEEVFDTASRAEILMFGKALLDSEAEGSAQLRERLGVRIMDVKSLEQVRQHLWSRVLENYRSASASCAEQPFCRSIESMGELRQFVSTFAVDDASPYRTWQLASQRFHYAYLTEQLRLAALFPRISSEIARFDVSERNGDELSDRQFLLSFDDGPTARGGNSDKLVSILREQGLHATFFILGSNLQARLDRNSAQELAALYEGQCVALHGWEHRSHAQWGQWQESALRTAALVKSILPGDYQPLFRPPYGQRRSDAYVTLGDLGVQVSLWNIDSQDWSGAVSAEQAEQRVQTLMLLWRRGIILFHDIHAKAQSAVPALIRANGNAGVQWLDCRQYR